MDQKTQETETLDRLFWFVERLLALLSGMAAAGNSEKAATFRSDLGLYRRQINHPQAGASLDTTARKCLALCQDYFEHEDSFRINNDAEYAAIIDALRLALSSLVDAQSIDGLLITSTRRFREIAALEDIHQLKARIEEEVQILERTVREKEAVNRTTVETLTRNVQALEHKLSRTRKRLNETQAENSIDALTRLYNRRYLDEQLEHWIRAAREGNRFILAMLDIDNFKKINDNFGHQAGDRVICGVAKAIRGLVRNEDVSVRYGGEEFAVLLPNLPFDKARERCQKLIEAIRALDLHDVDADLPHLRISISCGLTDFTPGDSADDVLQRADQALYQAKKRGKDRVETRKGSRGSWLNPLESKK